jgi:hypothetical protein
MTDIVTLQAELNQIREERMQNQNQNQELNNNYSQIKARTEDNIDRDISSLLKEDQTLTTNEIAYILDLPLAHIQPRVARIQTEMQSDNERKAFLQSGLYGLSQTQSSGVLVLG